LLLALKRQINSAKRQSVVPSDAVTRMRNYQIKWQKAWRGVVNCKAGGVFSQLVVMYS